MFVKLYLWIAEISFSLVKNQWLIVVFSSRGEKVSMGSFQGNSIWVYKHDCFPPPPSLVWQPNPACDKIFIFKHMSDDLVWFSKKSTQIPGRGRTIQKLSFCWWTSWFLRKEKEIMKYFAAGAFLQNQIYQIIVYGKMMYKRAVVRCPSSMVRRPSSVARRRPSSSVVRRRPSSSVVVLLWWDGTPF